MIVAKGWGWRHAGRKAWAVRHLTLSIERGERVLLLGPSGAGKSTLMHGLAGVLGGADEGESEGQLLIDGQHPTRRKGHMALVQQDPESAVVLPRLGDDVAFGCENLRVPSDEIWPRVRAALDEVGLDLPLHHSTSHLSGGQKQRLALAGALAMRSDIVLLDEPTANLDPVGIDDVRTAVGRLVADRSTTLVVVEHRVSIWADLVDRVVVLDPAGGVLADGVPADIITTHRDTLLAAGVWVPGSPAPSSRAVTEAASSSSEPLLTTRHLAVGRDRRTALQSGLDLRIDAGVSSVVTGPNGAGKSTLALTLAGLLPPVSGEVVAAPALRPPARRRTNPAHPITWRSRDLLTRLGTVFQEPEHQFVTASVRDEIAVGLRALDLAEDEISRRTDDVLERLHLTRLARANPFTLSGGEKRRLSVGTVLATRPRVIVLDEPTFGQDRNTWADLVDLVQHSLAEQCAVVSVTHDEAYLDVLGQHRIALTAPRHDLAEAVDHG